MRDAALTLQYWPTIACAHTSRICTTATWRQMGPPKWPPCWRWASSSPNLSTRSALVHALYCCLKHTSHASLAAGLSADDCTHQQANFITLAAAAHSNWALCLNFLRVWHLIDCFCTPRRMYLQVRPRYLAVAFDVDRETTFRRQVMPTYKVRGNRWCWCSGHQYLCAQ
jgi:hypothetical protein